VNYSYDNLILLTPEFILAGLALIVFTIDLFTSDGRKYILPWVSIIGLAVLIPVSIVMLQGTDTTAYGGFLLLDLYSLVFKIIFLVVGIMVILVSMKYVHANLTSPGEYYALVLMAILGMNVLVQSQELLTAYVALELLSFSLYILVGYAKFNQKSNEAALKYIIFGTFSSAIFLYGLSMLYSVTGTTQYSLIAEVLNQSNQINPVSLIGISMLLIGIGFKIGVVPFHAWIPDVYEGAPMPITAYLAIGAKIAAFAFLARFIIGIMLPVEELWSDWQMVLAVVATGTMIVGNVVALKQTSAKRMLAYSSIGHSGILLAALVVFGSTDGLIIEGFIYYLIGYAITGFAVFSALTGVVCQRNKEKISDLAGLADDSPLLAAAIAIGLFSLAGLPIFVGFTTKLYMFSAIAVGGFLWLSSVAVLSSLISLYYYLIVIKSMYVDTSTSLDNSRINTGWPLKTVVIISVIGTVFLGIYPEPLIDQIRGISNLIN
jgi:NADH-quinone oxidoreductase subunit N